MLAINSQLGACSADVGRASRLALSIKRITVRAIDDTSVLYALVGHITMGGDGIEAEAI
jgi:hypothetical protein